MAYQTLYRKYRPQRFDDLVGQAHVRRTLQNAMATGKLAHAYLFCGPRGTGKTTTARILAKALDCETLAAARAADPGLAPDLYEPCNECASCVDITRGVSFDVLEVDAATHRGIDDIRQIGEQSQQAATDPSRHRVFIIDEVHQLSRDGASAFLKTLEEPPPNVVFVLATTDPERMISTILSRCQRFDFRPVALAELTERLAKVCESESIEADEAALEAIARRAHGGVRDALSALEQARALCDDHIEAGDVAELFGGLDTEDLAVAYDAVVAGDASAALRHVDALVRRGADVRTLLRELIDWGRQVFLAAAAPSARDLVDLGGEAYERASSQGAALGAPGASRALTRLGEALVALPQSLNPRIDVETALVALALDRTGHGDLEGRVSTIDIPKAVREAPSPERGVADRRVSAIDVPTSVPEAPPPGHGDVDPDVSAIGVPTSDVATSDVATSDVATSDVATSDVAMSDAPVPVDSGDLDLGTVETRWPEFLATLKQRSGPRLLAYYHGSVPVAVEGDTVVVAFAAEFHRTNATKAKDEFSAAADAVFGRPLRLSGADVGASRSTGSPSGGDGTDDLDDPDDPDDPDNEPLPVDPQAPTAPGDGMSTVLDLVTSELGGEVVERREPQ